MRKPKLSEEATQKHGDESWTLVRIVSPMWDPEVEPPVRMHALMVLGHEGHIVGSELVKAEAPDTELIAVLQNAIANPQHGKVRKPTELCVEDERLIAVVEPTLKQLAPACTLRTIDWSAQADEVFAAMRERLSSRVPRECFTRASVSPELMRDYLSSMLALEALEPWTKALEEQVIAFSLPSLGIADATITVVGDQGQGLMVQEDDDPLAMLDFESGQCDERAVFRHGMVSTHFMPLLRASNEMVLEIRECGLVKNEDRTPLPAALGPDACPRLLAERDIILLTVAAKVVRQLFEKEADLFAPGSERSHESHTVMDVGTLPLAVHVNVPHPLFDWSELAIQREEAFADNDVGDPEEKLTAEELAMVRAFLPSIEARGAPFAVCAERIIVELAHYTRHTGATFADWTLGELERFVMEDSFAFVEEGLAHVPDVIIALAHWLKAERRPKLDAQAIEKRMRKIKPRFDERVMMRNNRLLA